MTIYGRADEIFPVSHNLDEILCSDLIRFKIVRRVVAGRGSECGCQYVVLSICCLFFEMTATRIHACCSMISMCH